MQAIEFLDTKVISPLVKELHESGEDYRMLILPDHPTPLELRTHTSDPVPYLLYDSRYEEEHNWHYNEMEALQSGNDIMPGDRLIEKLLGEER